MLGLVMRCALNPINGTSAPKTSCTFRHRHCNYLKTG
jgi:hypothetical protein